jgi:hypothetical protein
MPNRWYLLKKDAEEEMRRNVNADPQMSGCVPHVWRLFIFFSRSATRHDVTPNFARSLVSQVFVLTNEKTVYHNRTEA